MTVLTAVVVSGAARSAADELGDAIETTNRLFRHGSFEAKIPLRSQAKYNVHADGTPVEDKKQARRVGGVGLGVGEIALQSGEQGKMIHLYRRDGKIMVQLGRGWGVFASQNSAFVYIQYDRPIVPADVTPDAIARSIAGIVTLHGAAPGQALDELLAKVDETPTGAPPAAVPPPAPAVSAPEAPAVATVLSASARVDPPVARRGETVRLLLEYEVVAPAGSVTVRETRELSFDGETLPYFPVDGELTREGGQHASSFRQTIPADAAPGEYLFRGEVCVSRECIARTAVLTVAP
jgi:hypothetical protein